MTESELIAQVKLTFGDISSDISEDQYAAAVDAAERDVGETLPVTGASQIKWLTSRTERHVCNTFCLSNALKFRYKSAFLNQKFEHFKTLVDMYDKDWETNGVDDLATTGADDFELLGSQIDPGFQYDKTTGEDTTYTNLNKVIISPSDTD